MQEVMMDELFKKYHPTLVQQLPLHDALFRSKIFSLGLLPGNLKEEIKARPTNIDKAEHFLDYLIGKSPTNFKKLITFLLEYEDDALKQTAEDINKEMEAIEMDSRSTDKQEIAACDQHVQQFSTFSSPGKKRRKRRCVCGGPTKLFQARKPKDKKNIGRWFYKCANENCRQRDNFFQWADEETPYIWRFRKKKVTSRRKNYARGTYRKKYP